MVFMLRTESEHDSYGAGHAGTALSAGVGGWLWRGICQVGRSILLRLRAMQAFTNGISFEALNNIGGTDEAVDCCAERQRVVDR